MQKTIDVSDEENVSQPPRKMARHSEDLKPPEENNGLDGQMEANKTNWDLMKAEVAVKDFLIEALKETSEDLTKTEQVLKETQQVLKETSQVLTETSQALKETPQRMHRPRSLSRKQELDDVKEQPRKDDVRIYGPNNSIDVEAYMMAFKQGWSREVVFRATGKQKPDIYYHSPSGHKLRSRVEIVDYLLRLGIQDLTLENFAWVKEPLGIDEQYEQVRHAKRPGTSIESPRRKKVQYGKTQIKWPQYSEQLDIPRKRISRPTPKKQQFTQPREKRQPTQPREKWKQTQQREKLPHTHPREMRQQTQPREKLQHTHPREMRQQTQPRVVYEELPGIQCDECGKEFSSVQTLQEHMKSHMEVSAIPCPYCNKTFPQSHILHQHLVYDHEKSSNNTCPVCQKMFTRADSLISHMVQMHKKDGGLNCYICGKKFPSQVQLEMHVGVHTAKNQFECDYCHKLFARDVHLRMHLRLVHNIQDIPYCYICKKFIRQGQTLEMHVRLHTGEPSVSEMEQEEGEAPNLRKQGKLDIDSDVKVVETVDGVVNGPQPSPNTLAQHMATSRSNKRTVDPWLRSWLTKYYEFAPGNTIQQAIVYLHFRASVDACSKKRFIATDLTDGIRRVFGPGVGPSRRPVKNGMEKWHYIGIRRRESVVANGNKNLHTGSNSVVVNSNDNLYTGSSKQSKGYKNVDSNSSFLRNTLAGKGKQTHTCQNNSLCARDAIIKKEPIDHNSVKPMRTAIIKKEPIDYKSNEPMRTAIIKKEPIDSNSDDPMRTEEEYYAIKNPATVYIKTQKEDFNIEEPVAVFIKTEEFMVQEEFMDPLNE